MEDVEMAVGSKRLHHQKSHRVDRRTFLRRGGAVLAGAGMGTLLLPLVGCEHSVPGEGADDFTAPIRGASGGGPVRDVQIAAAAGEVELAPGEVYETWLYNGQYPGPEIRVREGERLRITVENQLPEGTTIHWHGIPLENAMDGVPGITQDPIPSSGTFVYEFDAVPAGTYIYHSHVGLQLDRALHGPLIVEERTPHINYDREHTLVLDDFLPGEPRPLEASAGGRGMMRRGGMMGAAVPPYEALLVNGRLPEHPAVFEVRRGERVRLRLVNPGGATTYRFAIAGHPMQVTHTDGRPVEPVEVNSLRIGMGERYDVIVEADSPGAWTIMAAAVEGDAPPARAVLKYVDAAQAQPPAGAPEGLVGGRLLDYEQLQSVETMPQSGEPDRVFDLTLSGGMMMNPGVWTIDGEAYPDAEPLEIREGERVRVNMTNMSMMLHPMHLHGHFFRTGGVVKDTVLVDPHMGRRSFDFVADNPGRWFFHCHNLYHQHAGMAREFRYV